MRRILAIVAASEIEMGEFVRAVPDCSEAIRLDPKFARRIQLAMLGLVRDREFNRVPLRTAIKLSDSIPTMPMRTITVREL